MSLEREIPKEAESWVHGSCYPFALALHDRTGWPLRGLTAVRDPRRGVQVAHLWVVRPDGTALDAGGSFDEDALCASFLHGETDSTRESARLMDFPDRASFLRLTEEIEGDFYREAVTFLDKMAAPAAEALNTFAGAHLRDLLASELEMAP